MPARDRVAVRRISGDPVFLEVHPKQRNGGCPLKILISAGEASADAHGAELLRALREERREAGAVDPTDAFGMGGPKLRDQGHRSLVDSRELLAMGFVEVLGKLPRALRALRELEEAAARERPAVAVVIDYADFHFRLAKRLRRLGVPVVYFIPPKVWAWRKGRVRILRERFARVLTILPFEERFYREHQVSVRYVGNPLLDELPRGLTRGEARARLGIAPDERTLTLMPGSRPSELKRHLPLMLEAAARAQREVGASLRVLLPLPVTADLAALEAEVAKWRERARMAGAPDLEREPRVSQGDAHACLVAADAGLIKSGTSTLEAGLLGCPHGVVYKPSAVSAWIVRNVVRYRGFASLVNLIAERELVHEILCEDATPAALAREIAQLLKDEGRREELREGFRELKRRVEGDGSAAAAASPSRRAAREVLDVAALANRLRAAPDRG